MRVRALGQAGFILEGSDLSLAIDPYLSHAIERNGTELGRRFVRLFPPPLAPHDLAGVTAVLVTHAHDDHCDPETLLPLAHDAPSLDFVGPSPVMDILRRLRVPEARLCQARSMRPIALSDRCTVTPVPSAHYDFDPDEEGEPAYLGYVIEMDGTTCYHSGDTILYDGLVARLRAMRIDLAILPVNGRDWARESLGITGNLEPAEAFALAREIGADAVIPMHNDLFEINRRPAAEVRSAWKETAPALRLVELAAGGEADYTGPRAR